MIVLPPETLTPASVTRATTACYYDQDGIRVFEKKGEGVEDFAERL